MASMIEELADALGGDTLGQLAGALGADNDAVGRGVAAALPALLGGLARNARDPQGASELHQAIGTDHDGSILDSLGAIFGGSDWAQQQAQRDGSSILGHVFGDATPRVEQQVQRTSGLDPSIVSKLLPLLAPIVLGYIGKKMRGGGDDRQLADELQQERAKVQESDGMFGKVLDMLDGDDDDGGLLDMAGDLLTGSAGRAILGKLLAR